MILSTEGVPFALNYAAYDQASSLFVAFEIYDISTGSAVFETQVVAALSDFGNYTANFEGDLGKTYLAIGLVYTSSSYLTVDTNRAPSAECLQVPDGEVTFLAWNYATYDQNESLFLRGKVYNISSGSPVFIQNQNMVHADFGVYFGTYTGTLGQSYSVPSAVFTDGTYTTVDPYRAPAVEGFEAIEFSTSIIVENVLKEAILEGQCIDSQLEGQSLDAILEGECA